VAAATARHGDGSSPEYFEPDQRSAGVTQQGFIGIGRSLVAAVRSEQITFLAASLAYYTCVSLMPLLLLVVVVASALGGEQLATELVGRLGSVLSPSGEQLVLNSLTSAEGRSGATVLGIAVLLWGTLKLFRGLDVAFSQLYGREDEESFLEQLRDATVALVAVGLGVSVSVVAGTLISISGLAIAEVLGPLALTAALSVAFLPLYVLLPDDEVSLLEGLPGAVLAAGGWTVLSTGFRVYAENAGTFQLYGVIGGVLLLVTWFYLGSTVLLVGGVLNAVMADVDGDRNRQLQQEPPRRAVQRPSMTDDNGGSPDPGADTGDDEHDSDEEREVDDAEAEALEAELAELRSEMEAFEEGIEDRTVHRDELEGDLKRYVRSRVRRGHARGWGPYLVLLYGTAMTLGAFYFLGGGWAILAMLVIWLSTLGLYVLMLLVGVTFTIAGSPRKLIDRVRNLR
jgi:YihY family inner membrane protein